MTLYPHCYGSGNVLEVLEIVFGKEDRACNNKALHVLSGDCLCDVSYSCWSSTHLVSQENRYAIDDKSEAIVWEASSERTYGAILNEYSVSMPRDFTLEITVDAILLKEVAKALLTAILFHRLFGVLRPRAERDLLDISFPVMDDAQIDTIVEDKANALVRSMDARAASNTSSSTFGRILVRFFEKRTRKVWFSKSEEEVCWEQWILNLTANHPKTDVERLQLRNAMETALQASLFKIVEVTDQNKDHIPPITTQDINPFPYQIVIPTSADDTWGNVFKKLAQ